VINTDYHGQVTINKVDKIIKKINNEEGAQQ